MSAKSMPYVIHMLLYSSSASKSTTVHYNKFQKVRTSPQLSSDHLAHSSALLVWPAKEKQVISIEQERQV